MTDAHKSALADGREQGRAIRAYLEALESARPKRGRKRTLESTKLRLAAIDDSMQAVDPLKRLLLIQERNDLESELTRSDADVDMVELEAGFVKAAKPYSERKGIGYRSWREIGVPAAILKTAGVARNS